MKATDFTLGQYKLRYGHDTGDDGKPLKSRSVWLWNGHYWQWLFPWEQAEFDENEAKYIAAYFVAKNP